MDKYEYKVKLTEIEKRVEEKDFAGAADIADGIDWRRVKSASTLMNIAEIYKTLERYEDSYDLLIMAYERSPYSRRVLKQLIELIVKMGDFDEALDLYEEYLELAPNDPNRFLLKYQIFRSRGDRVMDLIPLLEEYKSHEYEEEWSYELAGLYEEAGMLDRCIEECDELILWFSEGEYVQKALKLKSKYQELTAAQQEKLERCKEDCCQEIPEELKETEVEVSTVNVGKYSTIDLQAALAEDMSAIFEEAGVLLEEKSEPEKEPTKEFVMDQKEDLILQKETAKESEQEISEEPETSETEAVLEKPEPSMEEESLEPEEVVEPEEVLEEEPLEEETLEEIMANWETMKNVSISEKASVGKGKRPTVLFETSEISSVLEGVIPRTALDTEQSLGVIAEEPEEPEEMEDDLPLDLEAVLEESLEALDHMDTSKEQEPEVSAEPEAAAEPEIVKEAEKAETAEEAFEEASPMIRDLEKALEGEVENFGEHVKCLTEEQENLFAYFVSVQGMQKQLEKLLSEDKQYAKRTDSAEGNLVITGARGNGKTTLAIDIVKAFQKQRREKGGKLAKISAEVMNKKVPSEVLRKLGGGTLIIERAGDLKKAAADQLSLAMEEQTNGLLVILEDEAKEIERLFLENPEFSEKFNRMIEIPEFNNDELVEFGKSYARERDYYFEEMAVLALYDRIGIRQTSDHVVNVTEVKEMIDQAIAHAEKKNKKWFVRLTKKRVDEFGNQILLEEDFEQ